MIRRDFHINHPNGSVVLTLEAYDEDGRICCGIYQITGIIALPPKAWLRFVRTEIKTVEQIAKAAGCTELRLGGRDWSRILPDYEPLDGIPNGLRKRLI